MSTDFGKITKKRSKNSPKFGKKYDLGKFLKKKFDKRVHLIV